MERAVCGVSGEKSRCVSSKQKKQRASAELGISRSSLYYEPKLPGKDIF